jgi:hypothetical protein
LIHLTIHKRIIILILIQSLRKLLYSFCLIIGYYLRDNKKITNKNRIIDDHSNWRTSSRVADYLNRVDKIPHRAEGELLLCDFIPKKNKKNS